MADLLIELVGEEIPARMQTMAAQHFANAIKTALDDLGVWTDVASIDGLCGPRHLAIYASGIAKSQPDRVIEKRGPRVDVPEEAIVGFVASAGVPREALIEQDMDKIEELHGLATELDKTWGEAIENARLQPVPSGGNRYENYQ